MAACGEAKVFEKILARDMTAGPDPLNFTTMGRLGRANPHGDLGSIGPGIMSKSL